jgi:hypothetical protein
MLHSIGNSVRWRENRTETMRDERFSPREFLKNRRPEKFSDTIFEEERLIDRPMLEYSLLTAARSKRPMFKQPRAT